MTNFGAIQSGPCAFPLFSRFTATAISSSMNASVSVPPSAACSQTRNLSVHLPANLPIYVVMVTVLNEFGGNGVGTHWAGQGLLCTSGEAVEQLPCLTTQVAKVDGCCAGLPSPASSLVEGLLQRVSSLIGIVAWGSPSKLIHLLAVVIPSWYEGLSAATWDSLFCSGEDGRAPGAVCCVWV